jgi:dTMP kinase
MFVSRIVRPNLEKGINVISDRFADSTRAYQGYGGRGNLEQIEKIILESTEGVSPDLTFIIDINPIIGLSKEVEYSSFSEEGLDYHQRVREGYLQIAKENPKRCVVIPYLDGKIDEMQKSILSEILRRFDHNHGSDNLN